MWAVGLVARTDMEEARASSKNYLLVGLILENPVDLVTRFNTLTVFQLKRYCKWLNTYKIKYYPQFCG